MNYRPKSETGAHKFDRTASDNLERWSTKPSLAIQKNITDFTEEKGVRKCLKYHLQGYTALVFK